MLSTLRVEFKRHRDALANGLDAIQGSVDVLRTPPTLSVEAYVSMRDTEPGGQNLDAPHFVASPVSIKRG